MWEGPIYTVAHQVWSRLIWRLDVGNSGSSLRCHEGNYLAKVPVGGHLGLLADGGVPLPLFYLANPQNSFDCTGSPRSVLYTPSAWRRKAASACVSGGDPPMRCPWVCSLHKLCKKKCLYRFALQERSQDCPYQQLQVVVNCLYSFPAAARARWSLLWAVFLPAFQAGTCGLLSKQSYSQVA